MRQNVIFTASHLKKKENPEILRQDNEINIKYNDVLPSSPPPTTIKNHTNNNLINLYLPRCLFP